MALTLRERGHLAEAVMLGCSCIGIILICLLVIIYRLHVTEDTACFVAGLVALASIFFCTLVFASLLSLIKEQI